MFRKEDAQGSAVRGGIKVSEKVQIRFGAMSPPLSEQIPGCSKFCDQMANHITMLRIQGILNQAEVRNAEKRLIKRAEKEAWKAAQVSGVESQYGGWHACSKCGRKMQGRHCLKCTAQAGEVE